MVPVIDWPNFLSGNCLSDYSTGRENLSKAQKVYWTAEIEIGIWEDNLICEAEYWTRVILRAKAPGIYVRTPPVFLTK